MMALLLTPGLTPLQAARLRDDLMRLTGLPQAPMVYMDADRIAGRYMCSARTPPIISSR